MVGMIVRQFHRLKKGWDISILKLALGKYGDSAVPLDKQNILTKQVVLAKAVRLVPDNT